MTMSEAERERQASRVTGGREASTWTGAELRAQLADQPNESPREALRQLTRAMVRAMPVPSPRTHAPRRRP